MFRFSQNQKYHVWCPRYKDYGISRYILLGPPILGNYHFKAEFRALDDETPLNPKCRTKP